MSASTTLHEELDGVIVRPMLTINRAIDLYLDDLTGRGYSDRTRTTYSRILDKLADRLPADVDVAKITPDDCRRFIGLYSQRAAGTRAHAFSVLSSFFKWLYFNEKIARNPLDRIQRPRRIAARDLDVITVSTDDVRKLVVAARTWPEKLAIGVLFYTGSRRRAAARLRLFDYNRDTGHLRFREKGGKTIWKPVAAELRQLLEAALAAGVYTGPGDYLIPAEGPLSRKGDRDDRVVWRLVKKVAARAHVDTHVHALRAAFACAYLEQHPGDTEALQELMAHESIATTQVYLRRFDTQNAMERVRDLTLGVAFADTNADPEIPQFAGKALAVSPVMGAGGFEPPYPSPSEPERPGSPFLDEHLRERASEAVRDDADAERVEAASPTKGTES